MFIRVKNIKKKGKVYQYAYSVENVWRKRKKKTKQRVKNYLGRVYRLEKTGCNEFFEHYSIKDVDVYIKNNNKSMIITDLIKLELVNHGFKEEGGILTNGVISFDLTNKEFNKKIVLMINDGFLCKETISRLLRGKFEGTEKEVGYKLAKAFVEAGIKVPKEIFIGVFEKVISSMHEALSP